jgi:acetyl-CoA/propionyl-CoA carboxylase carboxyl transferase subunit
VERGHHVTVTPADPRDPGIRLRRLLDPGSLVPLTPHDDAGAFAARGRIDGVRVTTYCTDATVMGGAMGTEGCRRITLAIDLATEEGSPVVGLWHSGGARLAEGVEALDAVGQVFAAQVRASGRVPQISLLLGPAAGGAAYGPALSDLVVMAPGARAFVTGPDVVRSVTGEQIGMDALGGPDIHARKSGLAHVVTADEHDAYERTRRITALLGRPGSVHLASALGGPDPGEVLPDRPQRAYDVRPLLRRMLDQTPDGGVFEELQPKWAPNIVTGLSRLAGRTVGVLANNPLRLGGCLDTMAAEKAARFVRMCDALGVPLLVVVDVPGYLPGVGQEWSGVVRRGAKLLHAFAEAVVPRITLVTHKAYGGAYLAMNSRALGATAVFAWPTARIAVMGARAAVEVLRRRELAAAPEDAREALRDRLAAEHERVAGGVDRACRLGVVDEIVRPADTRYRLAQVLADATGRRGVHGNIPL